MRRGRGVAERGGAGVFDPAPASFEGDLLRANGLAGALASWELLPGMAFGEPDAWWRAGARRAAPHEGIDLCRYRDRAGAPRALGPGARVPAPWAGEVAAVRADFLGRSVFLLHAPRDAAGRRLCSALGHLVPGPGIAPGARVAAGEIVGELAGPSARAGSPPPHLHLTLALVLDGIPPGEIGWGLLADPARALLLDPAPLLARLPRRGGAA